MKSKNISKTLQERFGDPIGSYAGNAPVGVRSEITETCLGCGMLPIDGQCDCNISACECGMPIDQCECENYSHGMYESAEPCAECGMLEIENEGCGCTHMAENDLEEVAPPGKEKMVKALKKDPDIDNPWAVAWSMYNKEKSKK